MTQIKAGRYALQTLKFLPKIRHGMLTNVMLIKKNIYFITCGSARKGIYQCKNFVPTKFQSTI